MYGKYYVCVILKEIIQIRHSLIKKKYKERTKEEKKINRFIQSIRDFDFKRNKKNQKMKATVNDAKREEIVDTFRDCMSHLKMNASAWKNNGASHCSRKIVLNPINVCSMMRPDNKMKEKLKMLESMKEHSIWTETGYDF